MKKIVKSIWEYLKYFWKSILSFPKKIAFHIPTKPGHYYYLKKDNRRRLSFMDFLKFLVRNLYVLIVSLGIGLGLSIPLAPYIAPQTYSATSYFTVNQVVNVVVYQATGDLITSDLVVKSAIEKLYNEKPFERYKEINVTNVKSNLVIVNNDQHFMISVSYSYSIEEAIIPVLTFLFDSFKEEVTAHPEKYLDINRYVFEQERASDTVKDSSKKPFVILFGSLIMIAVGLLISYLIEKGKKYVYTDYFLDRKNYDILCLNKKAKDADFELICNEYLSKISKDRKDIYILCLIDSNQNSIEKKLFEYLKIEKFNFIDLSKANSLEVLNGKIVIISTLKKLTKIQISDINERFSPCGMITIVS